MAISQIKVRTLADKAANDIRRERRKNARYIYIGLLCAMVFIALNWYFGPILWLKVQGLTASRRLTQSVSSSAQVIGVYVYPGEKVKKGQPLATVYSQQQAQEIASLNARYASTLAREAQLAVEVKVATATGKAIALRLQTAESAVRALTRYKGTASLTFIEAAERDRVQALVQSVTYRAERDAAAKQLALLRQAQEQVVNSINLIDRQYNNGEIYAPEDGIVGSQIANVGQVINPGDVLAELFVGREYVWAYVGHSTLYKLRVGDRVVVTHGFSSTRGTIVEIPPLTVPMPLEFQKLFHPRERGQAVKIAIPTDLHWPIGATVRVSGGRYVPAVLRTWFHGAENDIRSVWVWGSNK